jgi:hypothetical protein
MKKILFLSALVLLSSQTLQAECGRDDYNDFKRSWDVLCTKPFKLDNGPKSQTYRNCVSYYGQFHDCKDKVPKELWVENSVEPEKFTPKQ